MTADRTSQTLAPIRDSRRARRFADSYDRVMRRQESAFLAGVRRELAADLRGYVVEVGAGTGANVGHYREADRVDLVEPMPAMREHLRGRLAQAPSVGPVFRVVEGRAEALPVADGVADAVVATLVLCSVADVDIALAEIARILRPGGTLVFVEHGRGGGLRARVQSALTPLMVRYAENCHLDRAPVASIERAGFAVDPVDVPAPWAARLPPHWPMVAGRARRAG